jgi:hypothetical protein
MWQKKDLIPLNGGNYPLNIGPFISSVDGKTPLTTLTVVPSDVRISKNDGAFEQGIVGTFFEHKEHGWFRLELLGATLGKLILSVQLPGALPFKHTYEVAVYQPPIFTYDVADLVSANLGEVISFHVVFTGLFCQCQWQYSNSNAPYDWKDTPFVGPYITGIISNDDNIGHMQYGYYRAIVTNSVGAITSKINTLQS